MSKPEFEDKSKYEYKIYKFEATLGSNDPALGLNELAKEGWDVQQIFNGETVDSSARTFALLRRKH
jgi:hypothetical protein